MLSLSIYSEDNRPFFASRGRDVDESFCLNKEAVINRSLQRIAVGFEGKKREKTNR